MKLLTFALAGLAGLAAGVVDTGEASNASLGVNVDGGSPQGRSEPHVWENDADGKYR
jgi:hypothetical protein